MLGDPLFQKKLPVEISDDELIVRAVLTPWHYKNGKIKKQALKPKSGASDISVMRQLMGDNFCKNKAVEIAAKNPKNTYVGLLALNAKDIREAGSSVSDSRDVFLGHADIDHLLTALNPDDPASTPEELKLMDDRLDALLKAAKFYLDHQPTVADWHGSPLCLNSPFPLA